MFLKNDKKEDNFYICQKMSNMFLRSFGREIGYKPYRNLEGVACDHYGNIIVTDIRDHCIQIFSPKGEFIRSFGVFGEEEGEFNSPRGVICDHDGNIVISDTNNHRIQIFRFEPTVTSNMFPIGLKSELSPKLEFIRSFGRKGKEEGEFWWPEGVTCDYDGNIVVCDSDNHRIQIFTNKGEFIRSFGKRGEGEGEFKSPFGVTCDHDGNIVVCDTYNHRIQVFSPQGKFLFSFGKYGSLEGQFNIPAGVTCDHDGNIIISDLKNYRIQVFRFEPTVTSNIFPIGLQTKLTKKAKFIGSFGSKGRKEGQFKLLKSITCDHDGNIVVCDSENHRIQFFKGPSEVPTLLSLCWEKIKKECI